MANTRFPTRTLVTLSLLLALEVVLTRMLSINTSFLRIGFAFLPLAVAGYLYGIIPAAVMAALADLLGMLLFPSGTFFPGFTLSALLTGGLYGLFLHGRPVTWLRVLLVSVIIALVVDVSLNTIWLSILLDKAAVVLLPPRLVKAGLMLPIQVLLILGTCEVLLRAGFVPAPRGSGNPA
jgi:ECF transporter S component (folate family)